MGFFMVVAWILLAYNVYQYRQETHRVAEEKQRQEQKEIEDRIFYQKAAEIDATYPKSALLLRDQDLCPDGCIKSRLEHGDFAFSIIDQQMIITNMVDNTTRVFEGCVTRWILSLKLESTGHVIQTYISSNIGHERLISWCKITSDPVVAILLEKEGRIKFLR